MSETEHHRSSPHDALLSALVALHDKKYLSVTTYRRNGEAVATPVEFLLREGAIYFLTLASSGKVKRLRRNTNVRLAACTMRGKLLGPSFDGQATLLDESVGQTLQADFANKYGLLWRLASKLRKPRTQAVRITLVESYQEHPQT